MKKACKTDPGLVFTDQESEKWPIVEKKKKK